MICNGAIAGVLREKAYSTANPGPKGGENVGVFLRTFPYKNWIIENSSYMAKPTIFLILTTLIAVYFVTNGALKIQ